MVGDELFVWQALDEAGWSSIAAPLVDENQHHHSVTLFARHREGAEVLRSVAMRHQATYNRPIRLARFTDPHVLDLIVHDGVEGD